MGSLYHHYNYFYYYFLVVTFYNILTFFFFKLLAYLCDFRTKFLLYFVYCYQHIYSEILFEIQLIFFSFFNFFWVLMKEDSGASSAWATETQLLGSTGPLIIQRKLMQWSCEIYSAVEPQGETTLKAMHGRH